MFNRQSLHATTSHGREYNNPFSCQIVYLSNSRLRDAERPWMGCASCETSNVLFKVFHADGHLGTTCEFTCRAGFDRVRMPNGSDDCYLPGLQAGAPRAFSHRVSVNNVSRANGHSQLRLSHSSQGFFTVVLGNEAQRGCRHAVRGAGPSACCLDGIWRVSTLAQMGVTELRAGA